MPVSRERLRWLIKPALILGNTIAVLALLATGALIWFERGWAKPDTSRDPGAAFLHGSIGTELMPLPVAVVLPDCSRSTSSRAAHAATGSNASVSSVPPTAAQRTACRSDSSPPGTDRARERRRRWRLSASVARYATLRRSARPRRAHPGSSPAQVASRSTCSPGSTRSRLPCWRAAPSRPARPRIRQSAPLPHDGSHDPQRVSRDHRSRDGFAGAADDVALVARVSRAA